MRRFDKNDKIRKANILAEQRYLKFKGFIKENEESYLGSGDYPKSMDPEIRTATDSRDNYSSMDDDNLIPKDKGAWLVGQEFYFKKPALVKGTVVIKVMDASGNSGWKVLYTETLKNVELPSTASYYVRSYDEYSDEYEILLQVLGYTEKIDYKFKEEAFLPYLSKKGREIINKYGPTQEYGYGVNVSSVIYVKDLDSYSDKFGYIGDDYID